MNRLVLTLLHLWDPVSWALLGLGILGCLWCFTRWVLVEREHPIALLKNRFDPITRWLMLHRRSRKTLPVSLVLVLLWMGLQQGAQQGELLEWSFLNPKTLVGIHAGAVLMGLFIWLYWDGEPSFLKSGDGRANAQFRDVPEEWGPRDVDSNVARDKDRPSAEILGYRSPTKLARRLVGTGQACKENLTFVSFRWDILSRHIFLLGPQGSGKTSGFYAHLMLSSQYPWIYQDSKAELPFREQFPDRVVWGLDARGHATRSVVWNPMEEVQSSEDFDLLVDFTFPVIPRDANPWVRQMSRILFTAILKARRWVSIQEIARTVRRMRLQPFLDYLDPIWKDLLSDPKNYAPVLQDLVAGLSCWETPRVRAITEGPSAVRLDDFISRGGYVMNSESSDALRIPVQVFWSMLQSRLRDRPEGASRILLLMDEFGDAGKIPHIERALILLRSKGVAIVAGIQNMGLLEDVYPQNWKAVLQGFGTRVWLARNMEDDMRERLSRALGKWTRRVPAVNSTSKETEREVDLMPLDGWGSWSQQGVALGRLHGFTYWTPYSIPIPRFPLGEALSPTDPWEEAEAQRKADREAPEAPVLKLSVLPPPPHIPSDDEVQPPSVELPTSKVREEDWL